MREKRDLAGIRFGLLTAIEPVGKNKSGNYLWRCSCDCGGGAIVINSNLTRGNSKSCGCVSHAKTAARNKTHGMSKTPLYTVWVGIRERCSTPSNTIFQYYGGRGISMCDDWAEDFVAFYEWAMRNGYSPGLTIDRIDNDGNYEPSNCRWVTMLRQANNKRNNLVLTAFGFTESLADLCRRFNVGYIRTWKRLQRGWDIQTAIERR